MSTSRSVPWYHGGFVPCMRVFHFCRANLFPLRTKSERNCHGWPLGGAEHLSIFVRHTKRYTNMYVMYVNLNWICKCICVCMYMYAICNMQYAIRNMSYMYIYIYILYIYMDMVTPPRTSLSSFQCICCVNIAFHHVFLEMLSANVLHEINILRLFGEGPLEKK
jgi:hypothetical protein